MAQVRIGFIGAGRIADLHARAYADNDQARLAAVADATPGRAEARAREWGADRHYESYQALLGDPDIDGVEILLPHHLHSPVGIDALRAGKAVSLQKPPGLTMAEADALLDTARASPALFRVFDNFLAYPPFRLARALLEADEIGQPLLFRISAVYGRGVGGWDVPADARAWRAEQAMVGGPAAIVDHGAHMAATMDYMMGPIERVHVFNETGLGSSSDPVNAPMVISVRFARAGTLGVWTMSRTSDFEIATDYYPGDEFIEVIGSHGMLRVNRCSGRLLNEPPVTLHREGHVRTFTDVECDWGESFRIGGQEFARAIEHGGQPDMDVDMARRVFAFQLAAMRSAETGQAVDVEAVAAGQDQESK